MGSSLVPLKSALLMTRRKKGSSFPCCLASNSYFSGPTAWSIVSIIFFIFLQCCAGGEGPGGRPGDGGG